MQISSLLKPEQIKMELTQQKRCNAINEVAQLLQSNPNVTNFAGFYEELLARERIESTCLGNEIAFPHARTDSLKGMVLAIGRRFLLRTALYGPVDPCYSDRSYMLECF